MISTAPGALGYRVLALVAQLPGELDAEAIAEQLHPEPRHVGPFTAASYAEHRDRLAAHRAPEARAGRVAKVAGVLHRLQQQGLVERCGGVRVAPWFEAMATRRGDSEALRLADCPDEGEERPTARGYEVHVQVLDRVRACPGSVREARPNGWAGEAYADLAAWGVLVTPTRRTATEAGRAAVGSSGNYSGLLISSNESDGAAP